MSTNATSGERDGPGAVEVCQAEVETEIGTVQGWRATYAGIEGVGHGRADALRQLVVNIAREGTDD